MGSDKANKGFKEEGRSREVEFIRRVEYGTIVFLLIYIPFTIIHSLGAGLTGAHSVADMDYVRISIFINIAMIFMIIAFILFSRFCHLLGIDRVRIFRPLLMSVLTLVLIGWLLHLYLAGSQNSILLQVVLTTLIVVSWWVGSREMVFFFILGTLGVICVVVFEITGMVPYAPLIKQPNNLAKIFLDWRVVATNGGIYLTNMSVVMLILYKIRKAMEKKNAELNISNRALKDEIRVRKHAESRMEEVIVDLKKALADVKTLEGLVPICAHCKKIRDDKGYWNQLEIYLSRHSDLEFTHGLCPDCATMYLDEFDRDKDS